SSVLADAGGGGNGRSRGRQLRLEHGQHFLLLPGPHEGLGARLECSRWKYRRERRAVADAAPAGVWFCKSLPGNPGGGRSLSSERRADGAALPDPRAFLFMNNLTSARSSFKDQLVIVKRKHTWVMSYIYIGTFGSFIGYSAAFPLLIKTQFPEVTVAIAFLGPLVGSLSRPLGGWLS